MSKEYERAPQHANR